MEHVKIKTTFMNDKAKLFRAYENATGTDVYAASIIEETPEYIKYGTGIKIEPEDQNIVVDLRPRSSVYKTGLVLANCVGTIDNDYRGEIMAVFYKLPHAKPYKVGDRIGQLIIRKNICAEFIRTNELSETQRGEQGYGSSDKITQDTKSDS